METIELENILESLAFVSNHPLKPKTLAVFLNQTEENIREAFLRLAARRKDFGVVLLQNGEEFQMATNPKYSPQVKDFLNADLREKLTDATLEVLGIITYRQPVTKSEIEVIRGVNSQYSIRHLLMRGLIEKTQNPSDQRSVIYKTTTEFLQHMGLSSISDLPDFQALVSQIKLPETPALKNEEGLDRNQKVAQPEVPIEQ